MLRFERSSFYLVLSNLVTMVVAVVDGWSLSEVMWIYWAQSLVIGFSNWRRMLRLRQFSTSGFTFNDGPVPETRAGKRLVAAFFAFHYGFFHLIYFFFLFAGEAPPRGLNLIGVIVCVAIFIVNHQYSYRHNLEVDFARRPNIGTMMFFPYARILPMHITIIAGGSLGGQSTGTLLIFLGLKTLADLIMHMVEHRREKGPAVTVPSIGGPDGAV
ncbi:MAG TPA: DUF6498-containing protein [Bacteroidota bacterium]|nr:DUF6498-containing protein [Bacteroidota bacterium]